MPAGVAEGGPFKLCDSRITAVLAASAQAAHSPPHPLASHERHDARHGDEAAGETSSKHSQWERCALSGLASFAAIGSGWQFVLPRLAPEPPAISAPAIVDQSTVVVFRSRAPPALAYS
jgi:hypothetical protein